MKKGFMISMIVSAVAAGLAGWFLLNVKGDIPINWDAMGEVTAYGPSWMILIFPLISVLASLLMYYLPKLDPKGENIKKSGALLSSMMVVVAVMMLGLQVITIAVTKGVEVLDIGLFINLSLGLLFMVIGYYMPSIKHNYMMGIRTPWTIANEKVWNKTHKISGKWFVASGVLFLVGVLLPAPCNLYVPLGFMMAVVVGVALYSYVLFRKITNKSK
jgi:uncharacterized membrane protein